MTEHPRISSCVCLCPLPDDDSSESSSAHGVPALTSPEVLPVNPTDGGASYREVTENGLSAPLDFSTTSSSSSEDQQPVNLSDRLLPAGSSPPNSYPADCNKKFPLKTEFTNKVRPDERHMSGRQSELTIALCVFSRLLTAQEAMTL